MDLGNSLLGGNFSELQVTVFGQTNGIADDESLYLDSPERVTDHFKDDLCIDHLLRNLAYDKPEEEFCRRKRMTSFCNSDASTSTLNQQNRDNPCFFPGSPVPPEETDPPQTLEEMILQLEIEEQEEISSMWSSCVFLLWSVLGTNLSDRFDDQFKPLLIGQDMPWSSLDSTIIRMPLTAECLKDGLELHLTNLLSMLQLNCR